MSQFSEDIKKFNGIYRLPVAQFPTLTAAVIEKSKGGEKFTKVAIS